MERRLSAILAADVVGYSRLMGANEVATLERLQADQAEVIEPSITAHGGRIVKLTGDGLLAEFPSVVGAVESAVEIQRAMPERNRDLPDDRRIQLRVGVNLGDVLVRDDDIFGDGVNVASRIEGRCPPGGIAVSAAVREHVGNRLDIAFDDMGEQELKNIAHPVRLFSIALGGNDEGRAFTHVCECPPGEDKPSIAVLPFTNMSNDPEQEYFSDGITEDIITDLSKIGGLFVVGRHSSFAYKGMAKNLNKISRELGVRFLLEGSVRKAGNRVRITGQLIDGGTGGHLWAERYDRDLTDIFEIQDEITQTIVDQLKVRLLPDERCAIGRPPTANIEAYNCYLQGRQYYHNATRSFLELARRMFVRATELDPDYARAWAGIANCDARMVGWYDQKIPEELILANADKALKLDPLLAEAHSARADALSFMDGHAPAEVVAGFERALELDPDSFDVNFLYARYCTRSGNFERTIPLYLRALELQPEDYTSPGMLHTIFRSLNRPAESERYGELAIKRAKEASRLHPEWSRPAQLAASTLAGLGRRGEAMEWLERAVLLDPDDGQTLYNAACTWSLLGDADRAFELLTRWFPKAGREKRMWLVQDADFDPIRHDPRFKELQEAASV
jgi:adenylate cyclase